MNIRNRVLWSMAAFVTAGVVMSAAATWTASWFNHAPVLNGIPFMGTFFYGPLSIFKWLLIVPQPMPWHFAAALAVSFLAVIAALGIILRLMVAGTFGTMLSNFRKAKEKPFAEHHFGKIQDAIDAGFIMGNGDAPTASSAIRTLGALDGQLLTVTDSRYIIVFGPTGSGKTYSVMIPAGLTFAGSAVFYAAGKDDIIAATSGYRATFSDIVVFDLGNPSGWRFNPLMEVRVGTPYEHDDCLLIASLFPPKSPAESNVPVYPIETTKLLAATIQHVMNMPDLTHTLGGVRRFMNQIGKAYSDAMKKSPVREAKEAMSHVEELAGVTRDNVIAGTRAMLAPWGSEIIDRVTSASDFRISDIVCGTRPMTVYIRIPDDMREQWRPVLNVFFSQLFKGLMHSREHMADGRRKIHIPGVFIDELHMFKFMGFNNDLAVLRDYGFYGIFCTQNPKSLNESYGRDQTILENDRVQLYMATGDADTARMISKLIGTATDIRVSRSRARQPGAWVASSSLSQSEVTRPAMDEGAIRSLPQENMILLPTGERPFIIDKFDYQTHPAFRGRCLPPVVPPPPRHDERPRRIRTADLLAEI